MVALNTRPSICTCAMILLAWTCKISFNSGDSSWQSPAAPRKDEDSSRFPDDYDVGSLVRFPRRPHSQQKRTLGLRHSCEKCPACAQFLQASLKFGTIDTFPSRGTISGTAAAGVGGRAVSWLPVGSVPEYDGIWSTPLGGGCSSASILCLDRW